MSIWMHANFYLVIRLKITCSFEKNHRISHNGIWYKNPSNNYTIQYKNNKFGFIKLFINLNSNKYIIIEKLITAKDTKFDKTSNYDVNNAIKKFNKFFKIVVPQNTFEIIKLEDILTKCILIKI